MTIGFFLYTRTPLFQRMRPVCLYFRLVFFPCSWEILLHCKIDKILLGLSEPLNFVWRKVRSVLHSLYCIWATADDGFCHKYIFIKFLARQSWNEIIVFQVRKRPLNKKEISRKEDDIVTVHDSTYLSVHEPKLKVSVYATS